MEKRRLGFDEFFVGFIGFQLKEPSQAIASCDRSDSCSSTVCPFSHDARHEHVELTEKVPPGLCLKMKLPF